MISIFSLGVALYMVRRYFNNPTTKLSSDMNGKTVIVTGSNTGIGKVTAIELLKKGAKVVFACRDENKTLEVINSIKEDNLRSKAFFMKLDLGSFKSIENFTENFKNNFDSLDILINNAGATFDTFSLKENIESTLMVNYFGPYALTLMLENYINPRGKIINVASHGHSFVDQKLLNYFYTGDDFLHMREDYRHLPLYCLTKLGNVYHVQHLAEKLSSKQIKTGSLHPGLVNTDIFSTSRVSKWYVKLGFFLFSPFLWMFSKDLYVGAQTTLHIAYMDYDELKSGVYFRDCREYKIKEVHGNRDKRNEFINFTEKILKKNWPRANEYL
jgi:retinol dehydrogenase-13